MTVDERLQVMGNLFEESLAIARSKGHDYAGTEDTLANFKRGAADLGLTPFQVWGVFFKKHYDAVMNAIKESPKDPASAMKSETLHGRVLDLVTYLGLLECLVRENERN